MYVTAQTVAGSVTSGTNQFTLANTPQKPDPCENDASVTNDSQIKVLYGQDLPDNGGSPILNI